jgi:hypothetical protein
MAKTLTYCAGSTARALPMIWQGVRPLKIIIGKPSSKPSKTNKAAVKTWQRQD